MATVSNIIKIAPGDLSERQREQLKTWLTFQPDPGTVVTSYRQFKSGELWVPRGAWNRLPKNIRMIDRRSFPKLERHQVNIELDYQGPDKKFVGQKECVDSMFNPANHQQGFIHRQPGSGKSNICLYFCAKVGTRTLVIVHTEDLLNQWVEYAQKVIPTMSVGIVRQNKSDVGQLTIAMLQTLYQRDYDEDWYRQFGAVINDECLHAPAVTFDEVLSKCTSRYRFGVSASETRADRMETLIDYTFGDCIHDLDFSAAVPVTVRKLKSGFNYQSRLPKGKQWAQRKGWHLMIEELVSDKRRNKLIAKHVNAALEEGRSVLVLSRRINHLQNLQLLIPGSHILAAKLVKKADRAEMIEQFKTGKIKCLLATQLADEGLDVPILSCVALVYPAKHTDLILQQVGRAMREYKGKHSSLIIDMTDCDIKSLRSQWHHRRRAYRSWGFVIKGNGPIDRIALPTAVRSPKSVVYKARRKFMPKPLKYLPK